MYPDNLTVISVKTSIGVARFLGDVDEPILADVLSNPDQAIKRAEQIKAGDRTTLVRLEVAGRTLAVKRFNLMSRVHTARHVLIRSRAMWAFQNGRRLLRAGLQTPRPIAMLEECRWVLRFRSLLITEWIDGTPLLDWLVAPARDPAEIEELAAQFARIWRQLGSLRLGHGDMKATNFIIDSDNRIWLIDLDGMRAHPRGPTFARARRRDLNRFLRNFADRPKVAAIFRAHLDTPGPRGGQSA